MNFAVHLLVSPQSTPLDTEIQSKTKLNLKLNMLKSEVRSPQKINTIRLGMTLNRRIFLTWRRADVPRDSQQLGKTGTQGKHRSGTAEQLYDHLSSFKTPWKGYQSEVKATLGRWLTAFLSTSQRTAVLGVSPQCVHCVTEDTVSTAVQSKDDNWSYCCSQIWQWS